MNVLKLVSSWGMMVILGKEPSNLRVKYAIVNPVFLIKVDAAITFSRFSSSSFAGLYVVAAVMVDSLGKFRSGVVVVAVVVPVVVDGA